MIQKVAETIKKYEMLKENDRVIVAVSGGPDSVALLNVLMTLAEGFNLSLVMAYLNHNLRGLESIREEVFVRQLSQSLGLPLESRTVDIHCLRSQRARGMSIEEIGREERYRFLFEMLNKYSAQKIALGHHFNDQAETIFINFIRGSGLEGLKGIPPVRDQVIIRPLIECTKDEISDYLSSRKFSFVLDASNAENIYLRNKIRNNLIPEIKQTYNPSFEQALHQTSQIIRLENDFMKKKTDEALAEMHLDITARDFLIDIPELLLLHEAIQNRILKRLLQNISPAKKGIAFIHIQALRRLIIGKNVWSSINLPFGIEARREYDELKICRRANQRNDKASGTKCGNKPAFQYNNIEIPGEIRIREYDLSIKFDLIKDADPQKLDFNEEKIVYMDYDRIIPPLTVRNMIPGDRIKPLGMKGTQKLKSFFINNKVPRNRRYKIPLLADRQSIIWIATMRISEYVKVTDKTSTIVKAEII
ncbi:MAG: tRNA lysidine(34) synthetase TilS [Deltaproteobacteria bacterium]|nr:tRNA lysidine(34) synthetase TilS [Deltaproteobacteria bacterium]